jgi:hypothetical protein
VSEKPAPSNRCGREFTDRYVALGGDPVLTFNTDKSNSLTAAVMEGGCQRPRKPNEKCESRLVFIGRELQRDRLGAGFDARA